MVLDYRYCSPRLYLIKTLGLASISLEGRRRGEIEDRETNRKVVDSKGGEMERGVIDSMGLS